MTGLQRLLLIPCLSPVVLMLLIASLNLQQAASLRVLTWKSPPWPIGVWIALGALVGSGVSAAGGLALMTPRPVLRRDVRRPYTGPAGFQEPSPQDLDDSSRPRQAQSTPWPERDVRDPAPTVSVPFRVVHRGQPSTTANSRSPSQQPSESQSSRSDPSVHGEDSNHDVDDWGQAIGEDW